MENPFVVVAGGTGFIGTALCERLLSQGYSVKVVTRNPGRPLTPPSSKEEGNGEEKVRCIPWDITSLVQEMEGAVAVINLAGESVAAGRWSADRKKLILESRLDSTQTLVDALQPVRHRPTVFINASAVGCYGPRGDEVLDESSPSGKGFLADVCRQWEGRALEAETLGVRVICLRIGVVLGAQGGALARMLPAFKLGLGGSLGSGNQWMSWIHVSDLVGLMAHLLGKPETQGGPPNGGIVSRAASADAENDVSSRYAPRIVNGTAPEPVTNREFSETLARVLGRPCLFKAPAFALKLAFGEMSSMFLEGQRVLPKAALAARYSFRFPKLEPALRDLLLAK